ncbi:ribokinase [Stackebrandtia endophytica]|uniref:Ribokinase n=1 Tax=Stackebrandtia endophytica TaxID=1496996 RepID=A0A543AQA5_9ACTN|nr:PfkB family carbohydrate kinase [Stackebrandtia endophytica]TQL74744.1 ribokinase [Stackebrandtia endophytica]
MTEPEQVIVVGSINVDAAVLVERFPEPGETVFGHSMGERLGGKGANQALAAARGGARVRFVGAVGDDGHGSRARGVLEAAGVDVGGIVTLPEESTGTAAIAVGPAGENTIIVASGANAAIVVTAQDLGLADGDVVVVQGEVPPAAISVAANASAEAGARFVLNLAPVIALPREVVAVADPVILNEHEAAELGVTASGGDWAGAAAGAVGSLARSVVITLGAEGAVYAGRDGVGHVDAVPTTVVDTTGAGDAFVGALAAALAAGGTLAEAVSAGATEAARVVALSGASPD